MLFILFDIALLIVLYLAVSKGLTKLHEIRLQKRRRQEEALEVAAAAIAAKDRYRIQAVLVKHRNDLDSHVIDVLDATSDELIIEEHTAKRFQ